jgi:hypothetical protein
MLQQAAHEIMSRFAEMGVAVVVGEYRLTILHQVYSDTQILHYLAEKFPLRALQAISRPLSSVNAALIPVRQRTHTEQAAFFL